MKSVTSHILTGKSCMPRVLALLTDRKTPHIIVLITLTRVKAKLSFCNLSRGLWIGFSIIYFFRDFHIEEYLSMLFTLSIFFSGGQYLHFFFCFTNLRYQYFKRIICHWIPPFWFHYIFWDYLYGDSEWEWVSFEQRDNHFFPYYMGMYVIQY